MQLTQWVGTVDAMNTVDAVDTGIAVDSVDTGDAVDTEWVRNSACSGCSGHSELQFPGVRCSGCCRFTVGGNIQ